VWNEEIVLIKRKEEGKDKNGFAIPGEEKKRTVFCNKKSIGHTEHYEGERAGRKAEFKCVVHKVDYEGEIIADHKGLRYNIIKDYDLGEDLELTLAKYGG